MRLGPAALAALLVATLLLPGCSVPKDTPASTSSDAPTTSVGTASPKTTAPGPVTMERLQSVVEDLLREQGHPYR